MSWWYNIWKEQPYIDLWSIVHFLGGFITGFILLKLFNLGLILSLFIAITVFILSEFLEANLKIKEYLSNRIADIVVDALGFVTAIFTAVTNEAFIIIVLVYLLLNLWGFLAWKRRSKIYAKNGLN